MSTTYQETFPYANGVLTGNTGAFGTWSVTLSSYDPFAVSSHAALLAWPGLGHAGTNNVLQSVGSLPIAVYTKSADAYFDIQLPASMHGGLFALYTGTRGSPHAFFGLDFSETGGSLGGHVWDLYFLNGFLIYDESDPPGMSAAGAFRFGCYHDVQAATVRAYTEPYGGGTRTWLGVAQANTRAWTDSTGVGLEFSPGVNPTSGGYFANVTITTTDVQVPARVVVTPPVAYVPCWGSATYTATGYDAEDNVVSGLAYQWTADNPALVAPDDTGSAAANVAIFEMQFLTGDAYGIGETTIRATLSASTLQGTAEYVGIRSNTGDAQPFVWYYGNTGSGRYYFPYPYIYTPYAGSGWSTGLSTGSVPPDATPRLTVVVSQNSAHTNLSLQEFNGGVLVSSVTAFTDLPWSSASTYEVGLFWDGRSSAVTPYYRTGSASTVTGAALPLSSAFTRAWAEQNWLGGIDRPSSDSQDRYGYFLRSSASSGSNWQPFYSA